MPTSMKYSERGIYDYIPGTYVCAVRATVPKCCAGQEPKVTENTRYKDQDEYENLAEASEHARKQAAGLYSLFL